MVDLVLAFWQMAQAPSPMVEHTRAHGRMQKTELRGERIATRFGSILLPEGARSGRATPLVVHFHGAAWVAEQGVRRAMRRAAVIGVELGSGSKVYGDGFAEAAALEEILRAFGREARPLYLTAFSAGYGAVRAILRRPELERRVDGVVLLDAIHSGYEAPEKERRVEAGPLAEFEAYARRAMAGQARMVVMNSEVFPSTFASTTECVDLLVERLGLKRRAVLKWGAGGMQMVGEARAGRLRIYGFAGNSAPDHVDHLHAVGWALKRLK